MKFVLFAHSDQYAAFKGNSSPKVKARGKNSSKTVPHFNLNIPTHAMGRVLLNVRPSYAGVLAADHNLT